MKTLKEFIDKLVIMWPKMTEEEKTALCESITKGNIIVLNTTYKYINKRIKEREKESKNENKTNKHT